MKILKKLFKKKDKLPHTTFSYGKKCMMGYFYTCSVRVDFILY